MKKLRISLTFTVILGFLSFIALILLYLAFSDIAKEPDTLLEWRIVQFCWITLLLFVISTFFTIGYVLKIPDLLEKNRSK